MLIKTENTRLHVRFNGRSEELDLHTLGLGTTPSDSDLRMALAHRYDCALADLEDYVIVREPKAIIVRPVAYYG